MLKKVITVKILALSLLFQSSSLVVLANDSNSVPQDKKGASYISLKSTTISNPNGGAPLELEVKTVIPSNQNELNNSLKWATNELQEAKNAERNIIFATEESSTNIESVERVENTKNDIVEELSRKSDAGNEIKVTEAKIPTSLIQKAKEQAKRLGQTFYKHERISLSLVKGTMNGTITGAALVVSAGVPMTVALPIAAFSGLISGTFMWFNPQMQKFFDGNLERKERWMSEGRRGALKYKSVQLTKSFIMNIGVYAVMNGFNTAVGIPAGPLLTEAKQIVISSFASTSSSGIWHSAIATDTRERINQTTSPEQQSRIQFKSNLTGFGVSMVSAFGGILTLLGVNLGYMTMGTISVTGIVYTLVKSHLRKKMNNSLGTRPINIMSANCRSIFAI